MSARKITRITVIASIADRRRGLLRVGQALYPCALGRAGFVQRKREGDGGTPRAALPLRALLVRPDKGPMPQSLLPRRRIAPDDAWCDDPHDRRYNRAIKRPPGAAEERLWRADALYDLIVVLGWNDRPVQRGRGSAIFWHLPRPGLTPTAGCVATQRAVFHKVLPRLSRKTVMITRR